MKNNSYLSLGSNIGDRKNNLLNAVNAMKVYEKINVNLISPVYETEPKYNLNQRFFYNIVVCISTDLIPQELLKYMQGIETKIGRVISKEKNQPRVIDIDILTYGNLTLNSDKLIIPHPEVTNRRFVLLPFCDIAPNYILSNSNKTIEQLLNVLKDSSKIIKLYNI